MPTRVPISLRGLPRFVKLWERMRSIGTRPFDNLVNEANYKIFLKCIMCICEAKVTYAQTKCQQVLTSFSTYTDSQLRTLASLSQRLPYPLTIFIEAIGNFVADSQPVLPTFITTHNVDASGAISFAPSAIRTIMRHCKIPYQSRPRARGSA